MKRVLPYLFLALCIFGTVFLRLGHYPIMLWDEGTFAVTALEMSENGRFLASYFDGQADYVMNFKPHLNVWAQVLSFKIFGFNELGLRIPAALCATITVFFLYSFLKRKTGTMYPGIIACLVLLTSQGYILDHVARSGDTDAMLVMWLTLGACMFFQYCESTDNRRLWLCFLFLGLATLTKGISAFIAFPGLFAYALFSRRLLTLLKNPALYLGILAFSIVTAGYYYFRELAVPGYFKAMFESEIARFWNKDLEGAVHYQPFWYYYEVLKESYFFPWFYVMLPSYIILKLLPGYEKWKQLADFALLYSVSHFLFISWSQTKLAWYTAPEYPAFAMITGLGLARLMKFIRTDEPVMQHGIKWSIILLVFALPYYNMVQSIISFKTEWHAVQYKRYVLKMHEQLKKPLLVSEFEVNSHLIFWGKVLPAQGIPVKRAEPSHKYLPGDVIITCNPTVQEHLRSVYKMKLIDQEFRCSCQEVIADSLKTDGFN